MDMQRGLGWTIGNPRVPNDTKAVDVLSELAHLVEHAADPDVRSAAIEALTTSASELPAAGISIRRLLLERVADDTDAGVIWMAAALLANKFDSRREVRSVLTARIGEEHDQGVRQAAVQVLCEYFADDRIARGLLKRLVTGDDDKTVQKLAGQGLLRTNASRRSRTSGIPRQHGGQ